MVINIKLLLLTTYIYSYYIDIFKVPPSFQSWPTFDGSEVGKPLIITTDVPAADPLTVKLLTWVVQVAWDIIFDPTINESVCVERILLFSPPPIKLHAADAVFKVPPTITVLFALFIIFLHPPPIKDCLQELPEIVLQHPPTIALSWLL